MTSNGCLITESIFLELKAVAIKILRKYLLYAVHILIFQTLRNKNHPLSVFLRTYVVTYCRQWSLIIQGTSGIFFTISLTCCQVIDKSRMLDRRSSLSSQLARKSEWRNSCILQQNVLLSCDFQYSGYIKTFLTYCGLSRSQTHSVLKSICTLIFSTKPSSPYVSVKVSFCFSCEK